MSIARHQVEWLSLLEVSGPFLSLPVLMKTFPQGLDGIEPHLVGSLRTGYEEWQVGVEKRTPSIQDDWVRFVLRDVLGIPDDAIEQGQAIPEAIRASFAEHGETLRPDFVIAEPSSKRRRLLIQVYPAAQGLEKAIRGRTWNASPATRMMELLHATGVRLGLVTNGERWMLVDAPRDETTGYASWYAGLWLEERITLQAFRSLLGAERFFNVPDDQTLESLLAESAENQQEVTDQLGYQVRKAVEVLVEALDRADQDHGRALLADVAETELYEAALTVMMRLVFLFCAEERELLLLGEPLFDEHYAVSTLREQLREAADQHGEDVLERRHDAWSRLLAIFRAVHGGIRHERLVIPAYGGTLLDPDRFAFLEGRKPGTTWRTTPAEPLPVNNRTVLHLLDALQVLQVRLPGGGSAEARKLSFRALDIEQIGYIYEGLLDHTALRATEPVLGLVGTRNRAKDCEAEVPLSTLETLRKKGEKELVAYLGDQTGRSTGAIEKAVRRDFPPEELRRIQGACGSGSSGEVLWNRLRPFAGLIRDDSFGCPLVIHQGSVYVTEGTNRRSSGTQYTPRSLTEPVVQYALEPLIYIGPAEGWPREKWKLRSARKILALKICDFACGSGAFLVQTCRYVADRLLEAWDEGEGQDPSAFRITPEGEVSQGLPEERLIPKDPDERIIFARRLVAQRCLYGVDVNPLAVEMAKLSMWLLTLAREQPFTFLDHAIRCGDSLLGITSVEQLKRLSLSEGDIQDPLFASIPLDALVDEAMANRLKLEAIEAVTVDDVARQGRLFAESEEKLGKLKSIASLLIAAELRGAANKKTFADERSALLESASRALAAPLYEGRLMAYSALGGRRTLHWPLEFPEVVVKRGGFDAFVGNPPFMGGQKITGNLGAQYRDFLVRHIADGKRGSADLCSYFFLRMGSLLCDGGMSGLLATNTIAQGDTREVGLEHLLESGFSIPRAVPTRVWPGHANLEVAHVWMRRGPWGESMLDGAPVTKITAFLTPPGQVEGKPLRLVANADSSFQGSIVLGMGYVLESHVALALIEEDPRNKDVLFPYLNGEDLNSRPDQSPSRWVINFHDWPLEKAETYVDAMKIVRERVKLERERRKPDGSFVLRKPLPQKWWIYAEKRPALYATIAGMEQVLVCSEVTKHLAFSFVPTGIVYSANVDVFSVPSASMAAILQSKVHEVWAVTFSSTLETRLKYSPGNAFETFPLPRDLSSLEDTGARYYAHRCSIMLARWEGLTKTYNRFHNAEETSEDIRRLRKLHVEMDQAAARAYGWDELDLGHGFHATKQGMRFTVSEPARLEILDRLLQLNHARYAEEVKAGLHEKKAKGRKRHRTEQEEGNEPSLF